MKMAGLLSPLGLMTLIHRRKLDTVHTLILYKEIRILAKVSVCLLVIIVEPRCNNYLEEF